MEIIDIVDYIRRLPELLKEPKKTIIGTANETVILSGADEFNNPYNLNSYHTHNFGGIIVHFKNDICVGHYETAGWSFGDHFMDNFCNYLKQKNISVERVGNDVLAEGCKVASYMSQNFNGIVYVAIHISIGMDLEMIKNICTKPMEKTPKGLEDYGITQEEIIA